MLVRFCYLLAIPLLSALAAVAQPPDTPRVASAGAPILQLRHLWHAMADEDGRFDVDLGPSAAVSVENAQFNHAEAAVATVAKGDASVRLYDAVTGEELWVSDGGAETECLAFTADDRYLVTGGEHQPELKIWDAGTGALVREIDDNVSIEGMVFSPDFSLLACGNDAGEVRVYDTSDPDPRNWPADPVYSVAQGPDRDAGTGTNHSDVNQVDWTDDGRRFFVASRDGRVRLWALPDADADTVRLEREYLGHTGSIKTVALSADETLVASASNWRTGTGTPRPTPARILVHDVATGATVLEYVIPDGKVPEVVRFSPDGAVLIAGTSFENAPETESATYVWRLADVRAGTVPPPQAITWYEQEYFDFSDDGSRLLIAASDGSVRMYATVIDATSGLWEASVPEIALQLAPNPARDHVTVTWPGSGAGDVLLTDAAGRVIADERDLRSPARLALGTLAAGVYHVVVETGAARGAGVLHVGQ